MIIAPITAYAGILVTAIDTFGLIPSILVLVSLILPGYSAFLLSKNIGNQLDNNQKRSINLDSIDFIFKLWALIGFFVFVLYNMIPIIYVSIFIFIFTTMVCSNRILNKKLKIRNFLQNKDSNKKYDLYNFKNSEEKIRFDDEKSYILFDSDVSNEIITNKLPQDCDYKLKNIYNVNILIIIDDINYKLAKSNIEELENNYKSDYKIDKNLDKDVN